MRSTLTIFLFFIACTFLSAQIAWYQFPKDHQLYPRDLATNTARVHLSGWLGNVQADSLIFNVLGSNGLSVKETFHLDEFPNDSFDLVYDIEAALVHYTFNIALKSADSTWMVANAANVVAGDVMVVQGQSNAQAVAYNGDANIWQNNFVRCFGNSDPANYNDQQWYIAEGNGFFTPGAVGQWPLRMGSLLQEQFQVPIAIVNGADPGKPIEFFQRNDAFPTDPATNYGRLLQRLNNASLAGHVRAVIFYQGESDGDRAEIHKALFEALYADWTSDLEKVEQYYVVQVREGCGNPSLQLRQYQKDFENYLPKLKSVTANGIVGHDGCHYNVNGYQLLGEKFAKQLAGDLYNTPSGQQLNVRVLEAAYSNETNTRITLTTDAIALNAQAGSGVDFKITGSSSAIINLSLDGNKIILDLDQPVYDGSAGISYAGHSGDAGGWVLNSDGYGLFSFYDLPIGNHTELPNFDLPGIMSGSGNCLALDGTDDCIYLGPVLNNSYTKEAWINWQGGGLGNNILSGSANTAFWAPALGNGYFLASGHNGAWTQVVDSLPMVPFQWTHVAVSYDETLGEMRLYKNGNLVSQAQNVPAHNDPQLYIGAYVGVYTFQGKVDEVRVWDTARSLEEIRANMCQKLSGNEPGLSSYFRFDQTGGMVAQNVTEKQDGQILGTQTPGWQRSAAPIGTKSTYAYQDTNQLSLALASGDSLVLSDLNIPEFVHLYFCEEVPNVLQPTDDHVLVDHSRYFGLYYPNQSIDSFTLTYHYKGNPFTMVDEPRLSLLQRRNNAQPYWETVDNTQFDFTQNTVITRDSRYQEYVLAIQENTVGTSIPESEMGWLFPNPSSGKLFVKDLELEQVVIFDAKGNKCFEHSGPIRVLELEMLPPGLYFVEMRDRDSRVFKQKVVLK